MDASRAASFAHLCPRDSHRDPDVGAPKRGCVVDSVSGHDYDRPAPLPQLDDPELLLGVRPRVDGDLADDLLEGFVVESIELRGKRRTVASGDGVLLAELPTARVDVGWLVPLHQGRRRGHSPGGADGGPASFDLDEAAG